MNTQSQVDLDTDSHATISGRQPWRTPKVIVGEMSDAENAAGIAPDGGATPGGTLS